MFFDKNVGKNLVNISKKLLDTAKTFAVCVSATAMDAPKKALKRATKKNLKRLIE